MSLPRPIKWYFSRADLIWPDSPFKMGNSKQKKVKQKANGQSDNENVKHKVISNLTSEWRSKTCLSFRGYCFIDGKNNMWQVLVHVECVTNKWINGPCLRKKIIWPCTYVVNNSSGLFVNIAVHSQSDQRGVAPADCYNWDFCPALAALVGPV